MSSADAKPTEGKSEKPNPPAPQVFLTADIQKYDLWWVVREWIPLAEGAKPITGIKASEARLREWGRCGTFTELDQVAIRHNALRVLVDSGYAERITEVYAACQQLNMIPTKGAGRRMALPWVQRQINPFEGDPRGRQSQGNIILLLEFHADTLKSRMYEMICNRVPGFAWSVYKDIEREYVNQMTAEEKADGLWKMKRGRADNHLWDCEVLQVLAADVFL